MQLIIRPGKGQPFYLEVESTTTVFQLKQMIEQKTKTPVNAQRLILIDKAISDDNLRLGEDLHIQNATVIHLVVTPAMMNTRIQREVASPDAASANASNPLSEVKEYLYKLVLSFPQDKPSQHNIKVLINLVKTVESNEKPNKYAAIEAERWIQKAGGDYNSTIAGILNKLKGDTPVIEAAKEDKPAPGK